jgi:hypothetical protein
MTASAFSEYLQLRSQFSVTREVAARALAWAQPLAMEALGLHTQRQTLVEGELPAYIVLTTPATNGGWGELMPVWFKPYERPVPFYCLDNWALFAWLYRAALGEAAAFTVEHLTQVVLGADLLIPFLPGTDGAGRFLRHGALPILLAILWLEPEAREAWLQWHAQGARFFAAENNWRGVENANEWLTQIEDEAWLVPEREPVMSEAAVAAFLADDARRAAYGQLFGGLCLSVTTLAVALGPDWRQWIFQVVNVGYRLPEFGVAEIKSWLEANRRGAIRNG